MPRLTQYLLDNNTSALQKSLQCGALPFLVLHKAVMCNRPEMVLYVLQHCPHVLSQLTKTPPKKFIPLEETVKYISLQKGLSHYQPLILALNHQLDLFDWKPSISILHPMEDMIKDGLRSEHLQKQWVYLASKKNNWNLRNTFVRLMIRYQYAEIETFLNILKTSNYDKLDDRIVSDAVDAAVLHSIHLLDGSHPLEYQRSIRAFVQGYQAIKPLTCEQWLNVLEKHCFDKQAQRFRMIKALRNINTSYDSSIVYLFMHEVFALFFPVHEHYSMLAFKIVNDMYGLTPPDKVAWFKQCNLEEQQPWLFHDDSEKPSTNVFDSAYRVYRWQSDSEMLDLPKRLATRLFYVVELKEQTTGILTNALETLDIR
jgi:hypothetical protein